MEDFYKILGVKEDASEEEIRQRWVELTKQYHPDRGEDPSSDERMREINEAYQVLKHSSTRVEYDLRRTFGQKKRKSYSRKFVISAPFILVIAAVIGIVYFMNPGNETDQTVPSTLVAPNPVVPTQPHVAALSHPPMPASTRQPIAASTHPHTVAPTHEPVSASTSVAPTRPPVAESALVASTPVAPAHPPIAASTHSRIPASTPVQTAASVRKNSEPEEATTPLLEGTFELSTRAAAVLASRNAEIAAQQSRRYQEVAEEVGTVKQPAKDTGDSTESRTSRPVAPVALNPPSAIATEDEVKKFFTEYVERYNRMDLEGFLSLFSSEAIQNKKDRLEQIRRIYTNFFNQGQEVRYRVQDMRIEIYQNAVEVKARYEIDQVLKAGGKIGWKGNVRWVLCKENGTLKILSLDYQHQQIY